MVYSAYVGLSLVYRHIIMFKYGVLIKSRFNFVVLVKSRFKSSVLVLIN